MARIVVLGAAGFLGSHLCDQLLNRGDEVIGVDDLSTSTGENISHIRSHRGFGFVHANICDGIPVDGKVDAILNFASPASPPRYQKMPVHTLRTGSVGTENALVMAEKHGARLIMASTSEVYGDPSVTPQPETYWGHVNPNGERSCYDEAKRYAEALCMAYKRTLNVDVGIVRIFNTYGPRLDPDDGRVVSNFICQALRNERLTMFGDGLQTRSFCHVDDEVAGIIALLDSDLTGPINIGNPNECTILELAETVIELTGSTAGTAFLPLPADDPMQRCPDTSLARQALNWEATIPLREGLVGTIEWFRQKLHGLGVIR